MNSFATRLSQSRPLLLDGATGTELNRRGVDTSLPLWSASALLESPDVLFDIHRHYVSAGAEIVTANTFRTHARNLAHAGIAERAGELTRTAVALARDAASSQAWVAGSMAPLEDCYTPQLVPDDAALATEHAQMAQHLYAADVDLILVETQNTIREAMIAAGAATRTGLPTFVSFVCGQDGRLLSGERVSQAVAMIKPSKPAAFLVNCVPVVAANRLLAELSSAAGTTPIGIYCNIGCPDPVQGWINTDAEDPMAYASYAHTWLDTGAHILGGCCGTTPAHIAELRKLLDARSSES